VRIANEHAAGLPRTMYGTGLAAFAFARSANARLTRRPAHRERTLILLRVRAEPISHAKTLAAATTSAMRAPKRGASEAQARRRRGAGEAQARARAHGEFSFASEDAKETCVRVPEAPMLGSSRSQIGLAKEPLRDHGETGARTRNASSQAPNGNTRPASIGPKGSTRRPTSAGCGRRRVITMQSTNGSNPKGPTP
jgi:hypothetical protein